MKERPGVEFFKDLRYDGLIEDDATPLLRVHLAILAAEVAKHISEWEEVVDLDVVEAGISRDMQRQCMREVWAEILQGSHPGSYGIMFEDVPASVRLLS